MLHNLQVVAGSVLTLFLLMSVGFFFVKKGMLSDETLSQLSQALLYVFAPAVMIDTFQVKRAAALDHELFTAFFALVGTYVLYMLFSCLLFRQDKADARGVLRFASIYGNNGFMGLPLLQAVLGNEGTMVAAMTVAIFNVATWSHGMAILGGRDQASVKKAVLNPGVVGFFIAITLYLADLRLPEPLGNAVSHFGNLNTPIAMFIIGGQMARADVLAAFRDKKLYIVSAFKLVGLPILTALVLLPFRLEPVVFIALVILSGCPTAGVTSLFAQKLGKDPSLAVRQITLSTLLCILTLPVIAVFAQFLAR